MTGILDRVERASVLGRTRQFVPQSQAEYFVLRLAQRLQDGAAIEHYRDLLYRYSEEQLLKAYRKAKAAGFGSNPGRSFHGELERLGNDGAGGRNGSGERKLAGIRIERRAIAVAILAGEQVCYPPMVRQLPSSADKAVGSAGNFLHRVLDKCQFKTAALEVTPENSELQRHQLNEALQRILSEEGITILKVPRQDVLASFGHPPLRFRDEVRDVIATVWPEIDGSFGGPLIKDALALALYCQVEYLLNL